MKIVAKWTVVLALLVAPHITALAVADEHPPEAQAAYQEMRSLFGIVPTFMKQFPEQAVAAAWDEMKSVQLGTFALSCKHKELIGLAVAAQIPCRLCIIGHTEFARLNGATDAEIGEALAMASLTRSMSTLLNGLQIDEGQFRRDVDRLIRGAQAAAKASARTKATAQR